MGRIRQTFIKRTGDKLIEKFGNRFTRDFETNKKIVEEIALISTKRLRNRIAGYITSRIKKIDA